MKQVRSISLDELKAMAQHMFDSMINIRPSQGSPSKDVLDAATRKKIIDLIDGVVHG